MGTTQTNVNKALLQKKNTTKHVTNVNYNDHAEPLFHKHEVIFVLNLYQY